MKRWNICCQNALVIYANRHRYAYLYGANGEIGSDALVDRLWNTYYGAHFKEVVEGRGYTKQQLKDHVRGKICLDCSSFLCMITQNDTTDITKLGVTRDYNSDGLRGLFQKGTVRTPREGTAGSMLWKKGHVAIDVGYGVCVEFASEFTDCRMRQIAGSDFVESGELNYVDYTGTNAR